MILFSTIVLSALHATPPVSEAGLDHHDPAVLTACEVDALARENAVPAAAVVLIRPGQPDLILTVSPSNAEDLVVTADSVFRIASVSKVFTAAAVAALVAEERLGLDDDLRPGRPWLDRCAPHQPVTLRQLLTHTGGFDDHAVGMFARTIDEVRPLGAYLQERMPLRTTTPGRGTRYSNHGVALAGLVAAETMGTPFAEAVDQLILEPTGMASTSFAQPIPEALHERLIPAFPCPDGDCEPAALDYRHTTPAGALVTSPNDMARFIHAILEPSDSGLNDDTVTNLTTRAWGPHPQLPGLALALQEQEIGGHRGLVHAGRSSGYTSLFAVIPDAGAGLFVVTSGGKTGFGAALFDHFACSIKEPVDSAPSTSPTPLASDERPLFVGAYLLGRAARATYERFPGHFLFASRVDTDSNGYLVRYEGGTIRRYGRVNGDVFRSLDGVGRMAFERDDEGVVIAMHTADTFNGLRFPATYDRLAKWESPYVMNEILSWAMGLPILGVAAWMVLTSITLTARWLRRKTNRPPPRRFDIVGVAVAMLATVSMMLFGFGFLSRFNAIAASSPMALAYGLPDSLARFLWLPWLIGALGLVLAVRAVQSWRRSSAHRLADRLLVSLTLPCVLLFTILLAHFNLLPAIQ